MVRILIHIGVSVGNRSPFIHAMALRRVIDNQLPETMVSMYYDAIWCEFCCRMTRSVVSKLIVAWCRIWFVLRKGFMLCCYFGRILWTKHALLHVVTDNTQIFRQARYKWCYAVHNICWYTKGKDTVYCSSNCDWHMDQGPCYMYRKLRSCRCGWRHQLNVTKNTQLQDATNRRGSRRHIGLAWLSHEAHVYQRLTRWCHNNSPSILLTKVLNSFCVRQLLCSVSNYYLN